MQGLDSECDDFLDFVRKHARTAKFSFTTMHGPRTMKEIFDGMFEAMAAKHN